MEPFELTVAQAAAQIRTGELSPVAVMESLLRRIERFEPSLRTWVTLDPEAALEAAHQAERELQQGEPAGSLHGVPVAIKDIFSTAGIKTTMGSKLYADFVPDYNATSVTRLKQAGAIILGKAVTTEFAFADPSHTFNPWNAAHTPGGSSSGSAVAVAARMCPAALGSQTVGSTLRPAAYNGIVGFKPTYGRISTHGVFPLAPSLDTVGILVRSVEDAALLLQALAGHDHNDPNSSLEPVPDYLQALKERAQPPHLGLVRGFFQEHAAPEVWAHFEAVAQLFVNAGAVVEEAELPESFEHHQQAGELTVQAECAAVHQEIFLPNPSRYGPAIRRAIEAGLKLSATDYLLAQEIRRDFRRQLPQMLHGVDALLTPSTPSAAPRDLTTTGDRAFQAPWTTAGLPAISLTSGVDSQGMPFGVQLVGSWFDEARLLAMARWCEEVLGVDLAPPLG